MPKYETIATPDIGANDASDAEVISICFPLTAEVTQVLQATPKNMPKYMNIYCGMGQSLSGCSASAFMASMLDAYLLVP